MRRAFILVSLAALAFGALPASAGPSREPGEPAGPAQFRMFGAGFGHGLGRPDDRVEDRDDPFR